jgi:S-DNA-T family DNA segregation ATPase FtsK/SpoIIIE
MWATICTGLAWLLRWAAVWTARGVWFCVRRPSLTLPLAMLGVVLWWLATAHPAVQLAALVVVPAAGWSWRRWHRPTWRVAVRLTRQWWARWVTYGLLWNFWMGRCGLTLTDDRTGNTIRPRLVKARVTPSVDRLLVKVPAGLTATDIEKNHEAIADAMNGASARVRRVKPKTFWLEIERRNPLTDVIPSIPIPTGSAALDPKRLRRLVIGQCDDGAPWELKLIDTHLFIAGRTDSGKSSVLQSILRSLAPFIRAGLVQVWTVDPKGGMEMEFDAPLFSRYERDRPEQMVELVEDFADAMDVRTRQLRGHARKFTVSTETPFMVCIVDEQAALTALLNDSKLVARFETAQGRILTQGRAPGFAMVGAVQDVTKAVTVWRDLYPTKIALGLEKADQVDMVLGDGMYDSGARCDEIPASLPGLAYVKLDGRAEPGRVRSGYVTDDEIKEMADEYATPVTVEPVAREKTDDELDALLLGRLADLDSLDRLDGLDGLEGVDLSKPMSRDTRPARGPATGRPPRKPRKPRKPRQPRANNGVRVLPADHGRAGEEPGKQLAHPSPLVVPGEVTGETADEGTRS